MPTRIVCPRCQRHLSVAAHKAGSYGQCPQCQARLWIPADDGEQGTTLVPSPLQREWAVPSVSTSGNGRPTKIARFVSAEVTYSSLAIASDGVLPELHLRESATESPVSKAAGINPLVTISLLCLSAVASIAVLLLPEHSTQSSRSVKQQRARAAITKDYFAELDGQPDFTYQLRLREAQRAYHRGDYRQERDLYREVLAMLHAERTRTAGVTGSPGRDRELEQHLQVLLSD